MSKKTPSNLLESKSALGTYLDDMLRQATETVLVDSVDVIDETLLPESLLLETKETDEPGLSRAVKDSSKPEFERADKSDRMGQAVSESEHRQVELSRDLFPLQVLMFRVDDNLLSIPLIKMANVINWPDTLTRLPNEPDWVKGILQYREHNVRIVDSSGVLQIRSQNPVMPAFILILEGESWGITCDAIENVATLEYDDIQWHQNVSNNITLGTIRDSLASLLSATGIVQCLQSGSYLN